MPPYRLVRNAVAAGLLLAQGSAAAFTGSDEVVIYWGQNSYGQTGALAQQSLATYCANTDIDVIPMAFLIQMTSGEDGAPVINFANSGNACGTFAGTELLDCPNIAQDIKTCQEQYGKTILLSIGGATYTEGGFKTVAQAVDMANLLWDMFGPANSNAASIEADAMPSVASLDGITMSNFGFSNASSTASSLNVLDQAESLIQTMPEDFQPFTVSASESGTNLAQATASGSLVVSAEAADIISQLNGYIPSLGWPVIPPVSGSSSAIPSIPASSSSSLIPSSGSSSVSLTQLPGFIPGQGWPVIPTVSGSSSSSVPTSANLPPSVSNPPSSSSSVMSSSSSSSGPLSQLPGFIPSLGWPVIPPIFSNSSTSVPTSASSPSSPPSSASSSSGQVPSLTSSGGILSQLNGFIPGQGWPVIPTSSSSSTSSIIPPPAPTPPPVPSPPAAPSSSAAPNPNFSTVVYTYKTTFSDHVETNYVTRTQNVQNVFARALTVGESDAQSSSATAIGSANAEVTAAGNDIVVEGPVSVQSASTTTATVFRPFQDASVDGFDLDIEAPTQNFVPFAKRLRALMDAANSDSSIGRQFYLTVAPQCPYPDVNNDAMLNGGVAFDAVYVQFYNNYCGVQSYSPGSATQWNYNFATWNNWAVNASANPNVKIFVGVPAGPSAAGSGYLSAAALQPVIEYTKKFSSFGGIMAWDASQAYANDGWLAGVKALIATAASVPTVSLTTSSSVVPTTVATISTTSLTTSTSSVVTTTTQVTTSSSSAVSTTTQVTSSTTAATLLSTTTQLPTTIQVSTTKSQQSTSTSEPATTSSTLSSTTSTLNPVTTTTSKPSTTTTTRTHSSSTTTKSTTHRKATSTTHSSVADPITRSTVSSSTQPSSSAAPPPMPPAYGAPPSY